MYVYYDLKNLHHRVSEICKENSVNFEITETTVDKDDRVSCCGVIELKYQNKTRLIDYDIMGTCIKSPISFNIKILDKVAIAINELKSTD